MSITDRKDPQKINSVAGTFETYMSKGKSEEFIFEALRKKDYTEAEIAEGYNLYVQSKNSPMTSIFFILIGLVAVGIIGYKMFKPQEEKIELVKEPVVQEKPDYTYQNTVTEIPKISSFDEQHFDDIKKLEAHLMKTLRTEYCEDDSCEPTPEEVELDANNRLLVLQGVANRAKTKWEKAKRKRVIMTNPKEIEAADKEIAELEAAYSEAAANATKEKAMENAVEDLRIRKFRAMIYKDYQGLVIGRDEAPIPIGAYANAVKFYKKEGRMQFHDPNFEQQFWKLFDPRRTDRILQQDSYNF